MEYPPNYHYNRKIIIVNMHIIFNEKSKICLYNNNTEYEDHIPISSKKTARSIPRCFFTHFSLSPTSQSETDQDTQAHTIPRHCTQRRRPAMCRHRADQGAVPPYHVRSECPIHPKSADHALARSQSARLFETSPILQSILIMSPT